MQKICIFNNIIINIMLNFHDMTNLGSKLWLRSYTWSELLVPLVHMINEGCEN